MIALFRFLRHSLVIVYSISRPSFLPGIEAIKCSQKRRWKLKQHGVASGEPVVEARACRPPIHTQDGDGQDDDDPGHALVLSDVCLSAYESSAKPGAFFPLHVSDSFPVRVDSRTGRIINV